MYDYGCNVLEIWCHRWCTRFFCSKLVIIVFPPLVIHFGSIFKAWICCLYWHLLINVVCRFFYCNSKTAAFRNGRCLSTDSSKVNESLKTEEAETVDIPPPPTEKVQQNGLSFCYFFVDLMYFLDVFCY